MSEPWVKVLSGRREIAEVRGYMRCSMFAYSINAMLAIKEGIAVGLGAKSFGPFVCAHAWAHAWPPLLQAA
jgi:hypothetical protein